MFKKINYIIFIFYFILITSLTFNFLYKNVKESQIQEYRYNMNKLANISVALLNSNDVLNLVKYYQDPTIFSEKEFINYYNTINNKLRYVQFLFSDIITYIYIYIPYQDNNIVFLNDAEDDYTYFGTIYDASLFPIMIEAMTSQKVLVEEELSYDAECNVSVISSFAPIFIQGTQIATLGIDSSAYLFDKQIKNEMWMTFTLSIIIVLLSLALPLSFFYIYEKRRVNKYIRDNKKIIKERKKSMKKHLEQ